MLSNPSDGHTGAMRESEWRSLLAPVLPYDQEWRVQGRSLAYRLPVGRVLVGVLAEGSASKGRRYIWRLTIPLFEPSEVLNLSYSERVGGASHAVHVGEPAAFTAALMEAIRSLPEEEDEMARLAELDIKSNIRASETAAYANTYLGDVERAASILESALDVPVQRDWEIQVRKRLHGFRELLRHGQADAVERLDAQAAETAKALGLKRA